MVDKTRSNDKAPYIKSNLGNAVQDLHAGTSANNEHEQQ